jgi:copper chaperone CopZ
VRGALSGVPGVANVHIKAGSDPNFTVEYDASKVKPEDLLKAIQTKEPQVKLKT